MESVECVVVGAGISGLSFANWARAEAASRGRAAPDLVVLEADDEPGGYCKTVVQDGFVWDYSGHFFHFRHPEVEAWLRARMPGVDIRTVAKRSYIRFAGRDIDFPFQKNIHQLPRQDFIDCLVSLYFRHEHSPSAAPGSFKAMLEERFGAGICERFLVPYNEKLYACDLNSLDEEAMGRFFPHADIDDIIRNMRRSDNASYNSTFTYPAGGAIDYVRALLRDLPADTVCCGERVVAIDSRRKVATTTRREFRYEHLISSAPLSCLAQISGTAHDPSVFSWNKVLVFNLGFDRKGSADVHWLYVPDPAMCFYRVGYYDNIMRTDRMSLYVEIGATKDAVLDVDEMRARVLDDLGAAGIVDGHNLVSWHSVVLDPAYVHITQASNAERARLLDQWSGLGIHSVGRYGGWTYCSIEDNMIETKELASRLFSGT